MASLTPGQRTFAQHLAGLTGLNSRAISAWMLAEESGGAAQSRQAQRNNNWLNIAYFDSGPGALTKSQVWKDPVTAARYTADFLKGTKGGAAPGIRAILHTAGQGPEQQLRAIAASPWASSHYGGAGRLLSIMQGAPAPGAASGGGTTAPSSGGSSGGSTRTVTTTTPGVDNRVARASLIQSFLSDQHADPVNFALQARQLQDIAPTTSTKTTRTPGTTQAASSPSPSNAAAGAAFAQSHSPLLELIHNTGSGPGFGVKDGKKVNGSQVFSSVWAGHRTHVHVAAGPKTVVALGKLAQRMGLHVGENSHFGGVNPVHVPGSYHYKDEAIDVSGDAKRMNEYASRVERLYGIH